MYAIINIPGSAHFEYFGPTSKQHCEAWLRERIAKLSQTEQVTALLPQRIVSDHEAESWRYLDGSRVCRFPMYTEDLEP